MRFLIRVLQGLTIVFLWWIFINILTLAGFYLLGGLILFALILFPLVVFLVMNITIPRIHKMLHPNHTEMSSKEELVTLIILSLLVIIGFAFLSLLTINKRNLDAKQWGEFQQKQRELHEMQRTGEIPIINK